jgi:hypothetical protein
VVLLIAGQISLAGLVLATAGLVLTFVVLATP